MIENNGQETKESGKMLALTIILTKFLLLAVASGAFWLTQMLLNPHNRFIEITRELNLF